MSEALTSAGRQLLSFDFEANTDHIKDFEWSASLLFHFFSLFFLFILNKLPPQHFQFARESPD